MNNKHILLKAALILMVACTLIAFDLPKGWIIAGSDPGSYEMGTAPGAGQDGKNAATIRSLKKKIDGFGTLMQTCMPGQYLGKRVRMSGLLKTKDVSDWSGLWLRIDQKGSDETLGFDNMHDGKTDRSVKGSSEWTRYEIVLDVPEKASLLAYGALLVGTGQIWFDDIKFEVVDKSVPVTGAGDEELEQKTNPVNLNFED